MWTRRKRIHQRSAMSFLLVGWLFGGGDLEQVEDQLRGVDAEPHEHADHDTTPSAARYARALQRSSLYPDQ